MRGILSIKCPGCQVPNDVRAVAPGFMSPTKAVFHCDGCESQVMAVVSRKDWGKPQNGAQVGVRTQITSIGPKLIQMFMEEDLQRQEVAREAEAKMSAAQAEAAP